MCIRDRIEAAGFDYVQIHGEIPETEAEAAIAIPILKAFNVSDMEMCIRDRVEAVIK